MTSSSQKRHKTRKGKEPAEGHAVNPPPATGIEEVLDYSRYFTSKWQMMVFQNHFHGRPVITLKVMHSPFFAARGFEFQKLLNFQHLQTFLGMKLPYYEELVRVFYTNLKITPLSELAIEICGKWIHINGMDWMNIVDLRYGGVKLTPGTIPEECNFDRALALSSMLREDVQEHNVRNVGSLTMNDRLLHYTWVHMVCPCGSKFAQVLNEDIFMIWCIKIT